MSIEEMIFARLRDSEALEEMLATYNNRPAVFYQTAGSQSDPNWGRNQYPRIDFVVDLRSDPMHDNAGVLTISIWCDVVNSVEPEQIEKEVRLLLNATFAQPDESSVICITWDRSEPFNAKIEGERNPLKIGCTMQFSITALPSHVVFEPDPIVAINTWTKQKHPNCTIIGVDEIDEWLVPPTNEPVIYWRISTLSVASESIGCVWCDCILVCHVFTSDSVARIKTVFQLENEITSVVRILMSDGSPLLVQSIEAKSDANALTVGQLSIKARFGVLRSQQFTQTINNIGITSQD